MTAKIAALFGVVLLSSSAFAGTHDTRVSHVYSGRNVVPVVVKQDQAARPYALTGQEQAARKTAAQPIKVGDRTVGYQVR